MSKPNVIMSFVLIALYINQKEKETHIAHGAIDYCTPQNSMIKKRMKLIQTKLL
jgi:hypothetical protein